MCRAFNFCNRLKVEAIMEYLFDHSKKKRRKEERKLSVVKPVLWLFSKGYCTDPTNGIPHN